MLVILFIIIPIIYFCIQYNNVSYWDSWYVLFFCAYLITALILLIKKDPIKNKILNFLLNFLLFIVIPLLTGFPLF